MNDIERVRELAGMLFDGEIDDVGASELETLVASNEEAARLLDELVDTEAALRGLRRDFDLAERTVTHLRDAVSQRVENGVMGKIRRYGGNYKREPRTYKPIEPGLPWLGDRRFWFTGAAIAASVLLIIGIHASWVFNRHAEPQEAFLYGQKVMTPGVPSTYRAYVRNALNQKPIEGAAVAVALRSQAGEVVWRTSGMSNANGVFEIRADVPPELAEGSYTLSLEADSEHGESAVTHSVNVDRSYRVLLTTDKPLYQPGQTIHLRTLSLATADLRPVARMSTTIEVKDSKGNKVFKKKCVTSSFGIASADFVLADQVNTGAYTVTAIVGDTVSERQVEVKRYALPKFKIDLAADRGYYMPGQTVKLNLLAEYTFGKPVTEADVEVVASEFIGNLRPFANLRGKTDAAGRVSFDIQLKEAFAGTRRKKGDAFVSLEAVVRDTAGHTQRKTLDLTVASEPIKIEVFPESGTLVPNVENVLYIVTAYPDGRPARTKLTIGKTQQPVETNEIGIAKVNITPTGKKLKLTVQAEDRFGLRCVAVRNLRVDKQRDAFLLRTHRAVYQAGETAEITVLSGAQKGRVFVDVVKDRRTVLASGIDIVDGRGRLDLDLPSDLVGTLEVHGYRILSSGEIAGDAKVIQVTRADGLAIEATLDRESYRPAEKAVLDLVIRRADGQPVPAALGLAGVDEAVFALHEMRPGLERVYFMLQEEILKPRYEIHARAPIAIGELVEDGRPEEPEREEATVVLFSAAEGTAPPAASKSETFAKKQVRFRQESREHEAGLWGVAAATPAVVAILLAMSIIAYSIWRMARGRSLGQVADEDAAAYRRAARWTLVWWALGFYLPLIAFVGGMILGEATLSWRAQHVFAVTVAVLTTCAVLTKIIIWTYRLAKNPVTVAAPSFRKLVIALPVAYVCAVIAFPSVIAAAEMRPSGLEQGTAAGLTLGFMGLGLLATGFASAAATGVLRKLTFMPWLGLVASRAAIAGGPVIVLIVIPMLLMGGKLDAPRGMMEMAQVANTAAPPPDAKKADRPPIPMLSQAEGELKDPTRVRRWFPETLLWIPELLTDDQGRARVEIPLADAITTWRVSTSAVSAAGELGSTTTGLRVFQDFFVDVDFPATLTQHDRVTVPIAIYNYLPGSQRIRLEVQPADWYRLEGSAVRELEVAPDQVTSVKLVLEALKPGRHSLTVKASGTKMADAVERKVLVEPDGRPVIATINGMLGDNVTQRFTIPPEAIDGATDLVVKVYPGKFSQIIEGLDGIFRMPHGCFEQTSSTTYPNILVLDYMIRTNQIRPEIEMKARQYVNLGYQRLLTFEVRGGGFDWYGKPPAHLVLTAYGLMEFCDMAEVHDVDPAVIERTRNWIFGKQARDGSWKSPGRSASAGGGYRQHDRQLATTAYVAWALAESGAVDARLGQALTWLEDNATGSDDPYVLAVAASALIAGGREPTARQLLARLDDMRQIDGEKVYWGSTSEGMTHSRGDVLAIETTAIAARAYLLANHETSTAHKALAWLVDKKDSRGTWRSTQATVHAMRALLAGTGAGSVVEGKLNVTIAANGKVGKELVVSPENSDVYHLISLRELVRKGDNEVMLEVNGKGELAYQIVATHYVPWRGAGGAARQRDISIDVKYETTRLAANDTITSTVNVTYNRPGRAMMTIIDLGIPPGFDVLTDAFDKLKERGLIERWSMTGRQVILYLRELESRKPFTFNYQLKARYPVKVKTPRSRVYQYYEPEVNDTAEPVEIVVSPVG